jgi:hypothetical protein
MMIQSLLRMLTEEQARVGRALAPRESAVEPQ